MVGSSAGGDSDAGRPVLLLHRKPLRQLFQRLPAPQLADCVRLSEQPRLPERFRLGNGMVPLHPYHVVTGLRICSIFHHLRGDQRGLQQRNPFSADLNFYLRGRPRFLNDGPHAYIAVLGDIGEDPLSQW